MKDHAKDDHKGPQFPAGTRAVWSPILQPVGPLGSALLVEIIDHEQHELLVRVLTPLRPWEPTDWWAGREELTPIRKERSRGNGKHEAKTRTRRAVFHRRGASVQ